MDELPVILKGRNVVIGISPCSRGVFAPLLNKLVYVLDSLMAGHYIVIVFVKGQQRLTTATTTLLNKIVVVAVVNCCCFCRCCF